VTQLSHFAGIGQPPLLRKKCVVVPPQFGETETPWATVLDGASARAGRTSRIRNRFDPRTGISLAAQVNMPRAEGNTRSLDTIWHTRGSYLKAA